MIACCPVKPCWFVSLSWQNESFSYSQADFTHHFQSQKANWNHTCTAHLFFSLPMWFGAGLRQKKVEFRPWKDNDQDLYIMPSLVRGIGLGELALILSKPKLYTPWRRLYISHGSQMIRLSFQRHFRVHRAIWIGVASASTEQASALGENRVILRMLKERADTQTPMGQTLSGAEAVANARPSGQPTA